MFTFYLKSRAKKDLKKLDRYVQIRILKKLKFYASQDDPLFFAESLSDFRLGEYRFRIGDYRVVFDIIDDQIIIYRIGHRKDIYR